MIKKRLSLLQNAFCNDDNIMLVLCHHVRRDSRFEFEVNDSSRRLMCLIIPQLMILKYMYTVYNCTVPVINIVTKSSVPDHLTYFWKEYITGN